MKVQTNIYEGELRGSPNPCSNGISAFNLDCVGIQPIDCVTTKKLLYGEESAKKDKSSCEGAYCLPSVTEQKRRISKQFSIII